ncbi:MAG: hypothetical protein QXX17_03960 [Conexivisphaerales archaeon]
MKQNRFNHPMMCDKLYPIPSLLPTGIVIIETFCPVLDVLVGSPSL